MFSRFTGKFTSEMMVRHIVQDQDGFVGLFKSFGYRGCARCDIQRLFGQYDVGRETIVRRQARPSEMDDAFGGNVLGGGFVDTTTAGKNQNG